MALDDYFSDPSQDCLARLFDAVNAMDISSAPVLTRNEKIVMRASERKDVFAEKFGQVSGHSDNQQTASTHPTRSRHRPSNSVESSSSFEDGILMRHRDRDHPLPRPRADSGAPPPSAPGHQNSPSDTSFNLGGSAVWVGDESVLEPGPPPQSGYVGSVGSTASGSSTAVTNRRRQSTGASSTSSVFGTPTLTPAFEANPRLGAVKDT